MPTNTTSHTSSGFSRRVTLLDGVLSELGRALQVLGGSIPASRPNPAGKLPLQLALPAMATVQARESDLASSSTINADTDSTATLAPSDQRHAAGLMRVNHVGEICAQALYRGQALFCRDAAIKKVLLHAAAEEVDHLVWCNQRLLELDSRPSLLNPLWYAASFSLGAMASRAGIAKNLGFMAETERQVEQHLDRHLTALPQADQRSRAIVRQMRDDEIQHRSTAEHHGAAPLPGIVKLGMKAMSKVMTVTAYRV